LALLGPNVWYLQSAPEQCSRRLGEALIAIQRDVPQYANLALFDTSGRLACSAVPTPTPPNVADRPAFRRALDTRTFTTAPYGISVITGDPVVGALQPITGPEGHVVAVLLATLHVGRLSAVAASDLASGLVITVFDRKGTILAQFPGGASWVGRTLPDAPLVQAAIAAESEAFLESPGLDGTRRLTAIKRLANADVDAFVAVGHDIEALFARANRVTAVGAAILMATALVAFGGAWYLGDRLVVRSVRKLADASRRVAAGDLDARVTIDSGDELQDLGQTFNALVATLGKQRRDLQAAMTELATLIQAAPVAIELLDARGRVKLWNPAAEQLFGFTAAEATGCRPPHVAADDDEFERYLARLRRGDQIVNAAWQQRRKDGKALELQLSAASLADSDGTTLGFVMVFVDMTDRNLIERQFHRAQRLESVGQLTGGMAHDFNNLLGVVIGNLELLTDDIDANHPLRPLVDAAVEASLRGAELNKSLLAFSRQQQLAPKVVEVNGVVEGMTKLLRRTLGEHIEIELHMSPELWPTMVDPAQLEAAILNLAVNARDAMPEGGRLTIETGNKTLDEGYVAQNPEARIGDYAMIAISDSGTGMPPDVIARAFEPFFTTKEVGKGTGLGLSMVYGFVKQSNGHIKIYSEIGRGTTIRLYLPRAAAAQATSVAPADTVQETRGNETVLVVEDNEGMRRVTVLELSRLGYATIEADSAASALSVIDSDARVDLLFSDVVMPGSMDGFALAREATRRRPGLRVLLTSGFTERAVRQVGKEGAPWRILSKPYRRHDLARMLTETLTTPASTTEPA
jgi:PAS domain S-box-containing protein